MKKFIVYTDGASKGNPGVAGIGVVICDQDGNVLKEYSQRLDEATNNEAEYQAVIFALKKIKALYGKKMAKNSEIEIRTDSELLFFQLEHKYKILDPKIQKLFLEVWNLMIDFGKVRFSLIPRQENKRADRLANLSIDSI